MYATVIFVKGKKARYGSTVTFFDSVLETKERGFFRKPEKHYHTFDWCAETFIGTKDYLGKFIETSNAIALSIAERLPKRHNLVAIVCPAFIAPKWRREIEEKAEHKRKENMKVTIRKVGFGAAIL